MFNLTIHFTGGSLAGLEITRSSRVAMEVGQNYGGGVFGSPYIVLACDPV